MNTPMPFTVVKTVQDISQYIDEIFPQRLEIHKRKATCLYKELNFLQTRATTRYVHTVVTYNSPGGYSFFIKIPSTLSTRILSYKWNEAYSTFTVNVISTSVSPTVDSDVADFKSG